MVPIRYTGLEDGLMVHQSQIYPPWIYRVTEECTFGLISGAIN